MEREKKDMERGLYRVEGKDGGGGATGVKVRKMRERRKRKE